MAKVDLPKHVTPYFDRHGKTRYKFQRRGFKSRDLPPPWNASFLAAYQAALSEATRPTRKPQNVPGSFGALVSEYLRSPEFAQKRPRTQAEYRRVMSKLAEEHGDKPVAMLERRHIRQMRDARAETPGAANTLVRTVSLLMTFAIERDYRKDNPAQKLKLFKLGEWRAWEDDELRTFEERWPIGTMQRRAYGLALHTGQRLSDLVAMQRQHRRDGGIEVVGEEGKGQSKTKVRLWIPEHPALTEVLEAGAPSSMMLLARPGGKSWDAHGCGAWFAEAIEAAGLADDCVLHGLRKSAGRRLAEAGATDREIMAVLGHATGAMVTKYTRQADQRRLATAAIRKLRTDGDR